jgi:uncharacterized Tic20 family protein
MDVLLETLGLLAAFSPIIFFMALFWWLRRSAGKSEPIQNGAVLEFQVSSGLHILLRVVLIALVAFTFLVLGEALRSGGESWYGLLIPLSVLAALTAASPKPVILDNNNIRQRRWSFGSGRCHGLT